ncbi:MAG: VacB/RNase II family 3'-5' exoribonuclease [Luteolibacter sp.]
MSAQPTCCGMPGNTMRDVLLEFMRSSTYQPMTKSQFARHLNIPGDKRTEMRKTLEALVKEGVVNELKKARFELRSAVSAAGSSPGGGGPQLVGTLKFHPKGHAFFYPDPTDAQNVATGLDLEEMSRITVNRQHAATALDGDRVLISILQRNPRREAPRRQENFRGPSDDEPRGKVDRVIERRSGRLVGIYRSKGKYGWIECDDKAIEGVIDVVGDTTAQPGQMVVAELQDWKDRNSTPKGHIIEVLGWPGEAGVDIVGVIHRFGLHTSFPEDVLAEARAVPEEIDEAELARRVDWRDKLVITIDPADAKDHDDAIWLEKTAKGWKLAVHIADVSYYIKPDSPMDKEAALRGNSTYLVDRVLPMLPTELSNGICSLKPDVDRLTKCAVLEISATGEIKKAKFIDAVIHSRAKLSYEQAQAILDGKGAPEGSEPELEKMVIEGWKLASTLRRRRFNEGALDLEMPEIKIRLDENGHATIAEPVVHMESHQLVEECMLAANEAVAKALREWSKPAIYRIHDDPDPSRLMDYTETAKLHGYRPGDLTNRDHIQRLLDESKGTPEEHVIRLGLLKSLKRAAYAADPIGHYGLAKNDYCHFTSPIRRYADLIVHRALQPLLENPPKPVDRTPGQMELKDLSRHISDTERTSSDAESETKQIKLLEYLHRMASSDDPPTYEGLIADARPLGLMVEIPDMGVRGVVKREELPPGRWFLEGHRKAWVSSDGQIMQMGMRVPLQVIGIDFDKRFVDFTIVGPASGNGARNLQNVAAPKGRGKFPTAGKAPEKKGSAPFHSFYGDKKGKSKGGPKKVARKKRR